MKVSFVSEDYESEDDWIDRDLDVIPRVGDAVCVTGSRNGKKEAANGNVVELMWMDICDDDGEPTGEMCVDIYISTQYVAPSS